MIENYIFLSSTSFTHWLYKNPIACWSKCHEILTYASIFTEQRGFGYLKYFFIQWWPTAAGMVREMFFRRKVRTFSNARKGKFYSSILNILATFETNRASSSWDITFPIKQNFTPASNPMSPMVGYNFKIIFIIFTLQ